MLASDGLAYYLRTSNFPTVELRRRSFLLVGEDGGGHRLPVLEVDQVVLAVDLDTGNAGLAHGGKGLLPLGHRTSGNHLLSELFEVPEVQVEPLTVERQSDVHRHLIGTRHRHEPFVAQPLVGADHDMPDIGSRIMDTVPTPRESTKTSLRQRLRARANDRWPQLVDLTIRHHGGFA